MTEPSGVSSSHPRLKTLSRLAAAASILRQQHGKPGCFRIQFHDRAPNGADHTWLCMDAPREGTAGQQLIPDPYCLDTWGYQSQQKAFQSLPPWPSRLSMTIWRGSTTGAAKIQLENIHHLLRYRLCHTSLEFPHRLDARFTNVVQCDDPVQIRHMLQQETLWAPYLRPRHMALHRWIIDIDGNVNSWGLLWKLLSGSCVLHVNSSRRQWYHDGLIPWKHYIPIAADLSDLSAMLRWCREYEIDCKTIACAGQAYARRVVDQINMRLERAVLATAH
ncbi:glycosyl transferase family 90 [Synechococcus sp. KORDI-100]|uniref:glycosyl transferase family 90 n=1 Tax=Synechococcus sp. KORDI-100 TaxID=1280380 RepID=UPI00138DF650|nr:glycosyl transferase family 90 [Synechococcus sp. KORDI-100]